MWTLRWNGLVRPTLKPARVAKRSQKAKPTRSTYDPTDVTSMEAEIRRITSKGPSRGRSLRTDTFGHCKPAAGKTECGERASPTSQR